MISKDEIAEYGFNLFEREPNGWQVCSLSEIATKITDGTHKTPNYQVSGIRFISIKNIRPFSPVNWDSYEKYISEQEHLELTKRCKPEYDDILFPRIGTLGFAKRVDFKEEVSIFVGLGLIKPDKDLVLPKFLEFYMNTPYISRLSAKRANGTGRMTLPLEETRRFPIPLPPINEQKRIVEKIEELFSELDKGIESLKTAREQLKTYRQSVLKHAFEGKLTENWRIKNNIPYIWRKLKIKELFEIEDGDRGSNYPTKADFQDDGFCLFLNAKNVTKRGFRFNETVFISEEKHKSLRKGTLKRGDIVFTSRGTLGNIALYDDKINYKNVRINSGMFIIRGYSQFFTSDFLYYQLNSPIIRNQIEKLQSGTAQPQLPIKDFNKFDLDIPSIDEQNEIVSILEDKFSSLDFVEAEIITQIEKSESLRQSILKSAFSGKLVAQDPKDEPASVLLERIKAEQSKLTKQKKGSSNGN